MHYLWFFWDYSLSFNRFTCFKLRLDRGIICRLLYNTTKVIHDYARIVLNHIQLCFTKLITLVVCIALERINLRVLIVFLRLIHLQIGLLGLLRIDIRGKNIIIFIIVTIAWKETVRKISSPNWGMAFRLQTCFF